MLKIIGIVAGVVVVLVAGVLVYATTRPDAFRVERTASIKAPPDRIFALINDFRSWGSWSPYEKLDPNMKRSLSGAPSGMGAVYAWESEGKAGAGRMEITDASPPSKVAIKLDFTKPFEGHNWAEFTLDPKGDTTTVTWAMHGPSPYVAKVLGIFVDMDRMIGRDFETGLANLKTLAEK
jgi:uncharacterized protein YndB with AHSA1/START domain